MAKDSSDSRRISVEVVYITPKEQVIIRLQVAFGSTIHDVITVSGLLDRFTEIQLNTVKVGIYNELRDLTDEVKAGDRIEVYRPLLADPKQARRRRAEKKTTDN